MKQSTADNKLAAHDDVAGPDDVCDEEETEQACDNPADEIRDDFGTKFLEFLPFCVGRSFGFHGGFAKLSAPGAIRL